MRRCPTSRTSPILIAAALAAACAGDHRDPSSADPESTPSTASSTIVEPGSPASDSPGHELWIAGAELVAYDLDGTRLRSLPVRGEVRRMPDGRIVALDSTGEHGEVLEVSLFDASGQLMSRSVVPAGFDPESCAISATGGQDYSLSTQSPRDFQLDATSNHACLRLQDRNENMSDISAEAIVDLATGTVSVRLDFDISDSCELPEAVEGGPCSDAKLGEPWVELERAPAPSRDDWGFSFDEASHWVSEAGERRMRLCRPGADPDPNDYQSCSSIEKVSLSGRWLWLSGAWEEGDYIYREVVLLDRATGVLLQIADDYEQPPKLVEVTAESLFADEREAMTSVVGESDVGWLPGDRLWIDGMLVVPEQRTIVKLGGLRAYSL